MTTYYGCECDNPHHVRDSKKLWQKKHGNLFTIEMFSMKITKNYGFAHCECACCGWDKMVNLEKKRSYAVSQAIGKAFFISA